MKIFIAVIVLATIVGGFVGGEIMDRTFSITGAVVGGVGLAAVLLGLGALFTAQEEKKSNKTLPPEMREVFDRMFGDRPAIPAAEPVPIKKTVAPPSAFETIAGICKFIAVQKTFPDFYSKHQNAIDFSTAFLRVLANSHPAIMQAFQASLTLPLADGSKLIHQGIASAQLSEQKLAWLDKQTTEVLRMLVLVVRDPALPSLLADCKWAIEGAFNA